MSDKVIGYPGEIFKKILDGTDSVSGLLKSLSFSFLLISLVGFSAQGFVSYYFSHWLIPPQVICVHLSFFFLIASFRLNIGFMSALFPCFIALGFMVLHDYNVNKPALGLLRCCQMITGLGVFVIAYQMGSYPKWLSRILFVLFLMVGLNLIMGMREILTDNPLPWSIYEATHIRIPVGLEYFPVALGYAMIGPCAVAGVYAFYRVKRFSAPCQGLGMFAFLCGIMLMALSNSRSWFLGMSCGILCAGMILVSSRKTLVIGVALMTILIVLINLPYFQHSLKLDIKKDPRWIDNWTTYLPMIMVDPMAKEGLKPDESTFAKIENKLGIFVNLSTRTNASRIQSPHNSILSTGRRFGLIPMLLLLLFYIRFLYRSIPVIRDVTIVPEIRFMTAVFFAAVVGFMVQSHFHNAGIFLGEMRNWLYFGLLAYFMDQGCSGMTRTDKVRVNA